MAQKKTREEYIKQLKVKNPYVELVGDYINDCTKVPHRCNIHNIIWDISPSKALLGRGCEQCGKEKRIKKRRKTRGQYIAELSVKNPNIKLKGEYINTNTSTEHYCEKHNVVFNIRPSDALHGKGCKCCKADKLRYAFLKNKDVYIAELKIKNPNLRLLGDYLGCETPTSHCCDKHNIIWDISPSNALQGKGCYKCRAEKISSTFLKPVEDYIKELSIKNPDIKLTGEYVNRKTIVEHYCNRHNSYFDISPECALRGYGCPMCASEKLREQHLKSESQYIAELNKINLNIVLRGKYIGTHVNTLHKCLICGCEWKPEPANLLSGGGCPDCNESKGERKIKKWLKHNKIIYIAQKRFDGCCDKRALPFDFYLPSYNICIEYQGKQHYEAIDYFGGEESLLYTQYHDKIKYDYCTKNNIRLICIPYWEDVDEYLNKNLLI